MPSCALAAQTPPRSAASALGPCPTVTVWRIVCVSGSIRETVPSRSPATQIAPGPTAIADGGPSSSTLACSERLPGIDQRGRVGLDRGDARSPSGHRTNAAAAAAASAAAAATSGLRERRRRVGSSRAPPAPPRPARRPTRTAWPGPWRAPGRSPDRTPGAPARAAAAPRGARRSRSRRSGPGTGPRPAGTRTARTPARRGPSAGGRLLAADHLRRQVGDGADHLPARGRRVRAAGLREPEVGEVDVALARHQRVAGLDVAVDRARARARRPARRRAGRRDRAPAPARAGPRARSSCARSLPSTKRMAMYEQAVGVAGLVDRDDPARGRSRRRAATRARSARGSAGRPRAPATSSFSATGRSSRRSRGAVHHAHAALAEGPLDAVRPDLVARSEERRGGHACPPGGPPDHTGGAGRRARASTRCGADAWRRSTTTPVTAAMLSRVRLRATLVCASRPRSRHWIASITSSAAVSDMRRARGRTRTTR